MGRLSTALNLPKQIFLKDWGATEFSTDPNILLSFTFILEPTPLHGSIITYSSVFSSIYPAPQKIYFWGSFWQLRDVNNHSTQWFNDSSSPILPLTGWERDNAQGPAGTITPILTNTKNISIKKQNTGNGKINLNKKYLYKATGTGLTPNINGLRFYDSGLTLYTNKVFYDETNTYAMWISPVGYWFIKTIPFNPVIPGPAFAKAIVNSDDPPTGNYTGGSGYIGTVTISSI